MEKYLIVISIAIAVIILRKLRRIYHIHKETTIEQQESTNLHLADIRVDKGEIVHKYHGQGKFGFETKITDDKLLYVDCNEEDFNNLNIGENIFCKTIKIYKSEEETENDNFFLSKSFLLSEEEIDIYKNIKEDTKENQKEFLNLLLQKNDFLNSIIS